MTQSLPWNQATTTQTRQNGNQSSFHKALGENSFATLRNMEIDEPADQQNAQMVIQVRNVIQEQSKGGERIIPKWKSLEDMEDDHRLKEVLVHTSKLLEVEEKHDKLNPYEKKC